MNEKFELNKIIKEIVNLDLQTINGIKNYGYQLDPEIIKEVNAMRKRQLSTHEIVNVFDNVIDKLVDKKELDLVIFFEQFKIRYTCLDAINQSLAASVDTYEQQSGNKLVWPESFTTFYIGFFYFQMKKFAEDFLRFTNNETFLSQWNSTFAETLISELNDIIIASDVVSQLELVEQWIMKYADPELLFNLIDFNYEENIKEKELFINKFNEFKLALQTLDLIIDLMAKEVKELETNEHKDHN